MFSSWSLEIDVLRVYLNSLCGPVSPLINERYRFLSVVEGYNGDYIAALDYLELDYQPSSCVDITLNDSSLEVTIKRGLK